MVMVFLRQRKRGIQCFYCGYQSEQSKTPESRVWHCTSCEADNWFDKNGEFTSPPSAAATSSSTISASFATRPGPAARLASQDSCTSPSLTASTLFCRTCLKHQHLITQSLASYYPSDDDPSYDSFVEAEPAYRNGLERRYPPVCEDCEPRVLEALKRADYGAKADHVGRTLDRLRGQRLRKRSIWYDYTNKTGALLWYASWIGQIGWIIIVVLTARSDGNGHGQVRTSSAKACIQNIMSHRTFDKHCLKLGSDQMHILLVAAISSFWWFPTAASKQKPLKYQRQWRFYLLQALAIFIRYIFWQRLSFYNDTNRSIQISTHIVMLLLSITIIYTLHKAVKFEQDLSMIWKAAPGTRISHSSARDDRRKNIHSIDHQLTQAPRQFEINTLAPMHLEQSQIPPQCPTPPPEADFDNASVMDWTPTRSYDFKPTLRATSSNRSMIAPSFQGQSPFYGKLPASVVSPAHQLRNPPNQPHILKASEEKKASLFGNGLQGDESVGRSSTVRSRARLRTTGHPLDLTSLEQSLDSKEAFTNYNSDDSNEDEHGNHDPSSRPDSAQDKGRRHARFADPQFFPPAEQADTGLEGLLASSFSIREEPAEVTSRQKGQSKNRKPVKGRSESKPSKQAQSSNRKAQTRTPHLDIPDPSPAIRRQSEDLKSPLFSMEDNHLRQTSLVFVVIVLLAAFAWWNLRLATRPVPGYQALERHGNDSAPYAPHEPHEQQWDRVLARAAREIERIWGRMGI